MNKADSYYKENLKLILDFGTWDENPRPRYKDGEEANSLFMTQVFEKYNIQHGEFPIPTIRKTAIKTGIKEIFWIYQKQSNKLSDARELGVNWWDEWDIGDGTIGQRYGATVKKYDLMNKLLKGLKENPFGRRHIMNLLQEPDMEETKGLFPCAFETLWSVRKVNDEYFLDLTLNQRSNDYIMAGYINKIQYVALQMMVAGHLNYRVGNFSHMVQNLHIYDRHTEAMLELIKKPTLAETPMLIISGNKNFYDYTIDDFAIINTSKIPKLESKLEIAI
tara:strand:- start:11779 stop:12609 length:831 start_codon:yes stop_codon:yes gene_type:complete